MHWDKFKLGSHAWDDPIIRVTAAAKEQGMPVLTSIIGEVLPLKADVQTRSWWGGLA